MSLINEILDRADSHFKRIADLEMLAMGYAPANVFDRSGEVDLPIEHMPEREVDNS